MASPKASKLVVAVVVLVSGFLLLMYIREANPNLVSGQSGGQAPSQPKSEDKILQLVNELSVLTGKKVHLGDVPQQNTVKDVKVVSELGEEDGAPAVLKNLRKKGVSYGLAERDITKMSKEELELSMHSTLDQTSTVCHRKLRMGLLGDGGWEICDDVDVRPRQPCVVYSFGINNEFSFDDFSASVYDCQVYSFDPSMKKETHNRSDHVHFYKIGLADKTFVDPKKGWKMYTFSDIRKMLGHENTQIDVVKMDIEHSEWTAVKQMFEVGEMKKFKQFLLEFHLGYVDASRLQLVQRLEREGYKTFYVHKNPACQRKINGFPSSTTICYEVHYVRRP